MKEAEIKLMLPRLYPDHTCIYEFISGNMTARVDALFIRNLWTGVEIKTEHDSLVRLPNQILAYQSAFDQQVLCTHEKHLKRSLDMLPEGWGIIHLPTLEWIRMPQTHKVNLLGHLWREELLGILTRRGIRGVTKFSTRRMREKIMDIMSPEDIRDEVNGLVLYRYHSGEWRGDVNLQHLVEHLRLGKEVVLKNRDHSIAPLIDVEDLCRVVPIEDPAVLRRGSIVLARVKGKLVLHKITSVRTREGKTVYQISDNRGQIDGWVPKNKIYGLFIEKGEHLFDNLVL